MLIFTRVRKSIGAMLRWVWSHKLRTSAYSLLVMVGLYGSLFTAVSCSSSPTTQSAQTPDGRTLAYNTHEAGDVRGPSAILLHGAPADANAWNRLIKRAHEINAHQVIAVDRLGYGNSTSEDELTLAGHAASITSLLDETSKRKPILVGHSYGGPVALRFAVDYPDKVGGVVLVAGACDADMQDAQGLRRFLNAIRLIVPEDWERSNRELLALTDENRAMRPMLSKVVCPVYIVHGTWDGVCPHDSTIAYLEKELVNASLVEVVSLDKAGHNLHLNRLDEVIKTINAAADHDTDQKEP